MEVVGVALACISILDQSLTYLDEIRKSSKSLGTAVTSANVKIAAIKSFLELWLQTWKHEIYGMVDTRHQATLGNLFTQMATEIGNAEHILKKYDPREGPAAVVDPGHTITECILGTLKQNDGSTTPAMKNLTLDQSTLMLKASKNHSSTAHEVQHNIGWRKKFTWARSGQKDLAECLARINMLRTDIAEISNILARNHLTKGQSKRKATEEEVGAVLEKTFDITTKIWRATNSFRKCLPFFQGQAASDVDLMLVKNRQTPPEQSHRFLGRMELLPDSIKFPLYLRDHQSNSMKFALIESSDSSTTVMQAIKSSAPGAYEVKVFSQDGVFHTLHTICIDPIEVKPSISLATLLEQSSSITNQTMDMWNRLGIAHLLAMSVLHLQDTGWFNANLHSNGIRLHGSRDSCFSDALSPLLPVITVLQPVASRDIIQNDTQTFRSQTLRTIHNQFPWAHSHDPELNKAIHELGLILLEIGTGKPLTSIVAELNHVMGDNIALKEELNKLVAKTKLGKSFREVTGVCLNVYFGFCGTDEGLRAAFLDKVVNRLAELETWAGSLEG